MKAINNCYSALTGMMLDGGEIVPDNLTEIIQKFSSLANDKAFIKYTATWLDDSGQPIESLGIGELLHSIELYREHYNKEQQHG